MGSPDRDYAYDVYISYSQADGSWVSDHLLPRLEQAGLRVCIDYRDFAIGRAGIVNVEQAVDASRRTLLVMTPDWVSDQ